MSKKIFVTDGFGNPDYVVVMFESVEHNRLSGVGQELKGSVSFYLSEGEELNHEAFDRFDTLSGDESYFVTDEDDVEWLKHNT